MKSKVETALYSFNLGLNCAQSVILGSVASDHKWDFLIQNLDNPKL